MEDLQLWVYIIFGILYFLSRTLRKKNPEQPRQSPLETEDSEPRRQPVTFEELLQEVTGQRSPAQVESEVEEVLPEEPKHNPTQKEQVTEDRRHFSDAESREIYERSVKAAEEMSETTFEREDHFKLKSKLSEEEPTSDHISDIRQLLATPDSAKKAIILSEIFNRKY